MNTNILQFMVTDDEMLSRICTSFEESESIAIDTEYVRESTYYPQPSLVQISDGSKHAILDVLVLEYLYPLQKLFATSKDKIFHSFEQDLIVLECLGCPIKSSVFDTQLATAFLGFGYKVGYQSLVEEFLDIKLEKGYARSAWLTRPLSSNQINYAVEDVIYLHDLCYLLSEQLQRTGKLSWFEEESRRILEEYYTNGFERAIPKIAGENKITSVHDKNRLGKLAEWREAKAKEANLPRRWVAKDHDLIAVARNKKSINSLIAICQKNCENTIDMEAKELEELLGSVEYDANEVTPVSNQDKRLIKRIKLLVSQAAKEHEIEESLIASEKQIKRFVRDKENRANMALLSGWRAQIMKALD